MSYKGYTIYSHIIQSMMLVHRELLEIVKDIWTSNYVMCIYIYIYNTVEIV